MEQEDFSKAMEEVFKNALQQADIITANAETIRRDALKELDAARQMRASMEKEGSALAQQYFEGKRNQLAEAARTELLRDLVRRHLEAGKPTQEIIHWIGVQPDFVKGIKEVMDRVERYRSERNASLPGHPRLRYETKGRGGTVYYENGESRFDMWWEFAGGNAIVIVDIPTEKQWELRTRIPLSERLTVLTFIGEQIIKDQLSNSGSFIIGENVITFYSK